MIFSALVIRLWSDGIEGGRSLHKSSETEPDRLRRSLLSAAEPDETEAGGIDSNGIHHFR